MAWNSHCVVVEVSYISRVRLNAVACTNCPFRPQAAPLVADTPFAYTVKAPELGILYHIFGSPTRLPPSSSPSSPTTSPQPRQEGPTRHPSLADGYSARLHVAKRQRPLYGGNKREEDCDHQAAAALLGLMHMGARLQD